MPRHRPYKRRRTTRKRRSRAVKRRRVSSRSVMRALGNQFPWKLAIGHDTGTFSAAINTQDIAWLGTVGAVGEVNGDTAYPHTKFCYKQYANQANLIMPYSATYVTNGENLSGTGTWTNEWLFKSQKARFMFTNSSASSMFLELYHVYMRQEMDETNPVGMTGVFTGITSWLGTGGVPTQTNIADDALTRITPGVTPYDVPGLTHICYIKRVGIKRLEPGANALHILRTRRSYNYSVGTTASSLSDFGYLPKITVHLFARFWGEMVTGTGAPVLAPVKLVYGAIYRTKFKRTSNPLYGRIERGTDMNTMSTGTGGLIIPQEQPGATAVAGFVPNVV